MGTIINKSDKPFSTRSLMQAPKRQKKLKQKDEHSLYY